MRWHSDVRMCLACTRGVRYNCAVSAFAGVVTTGIYCRPGCGANPKPGNVRPFEFAAAAEAAGYRACMRCRPYRTNVQVPLRGPDVVCRAIKLILDGALDNHGEEHLASRLDVSARHLRRLFRERVGATPDQLARSCRAHFARRLLDDTDLLVTDVAFAAGFSSLRQFNRTMLAIFRAPPLALRARRRKSDRLVADGGLALRMEYSRPLDWPAMINCLRARAIDGVECVDNFVYRRTIVVDGDLGALEIREGGPGFLELRMHLPHWRGLLHLVQRARGIFNLDDAPRGTSPDGGEGPTAAWRGIASTLQPPGTWDPFELGVCAVLAQQGDAARAITSRLVEKHGQRVPGLSELGLTHTFPAPATLAAADLEGLGVDRTQAVAIRALAGLVADEHWYGSASLGDLLTRASSIHGLDHAITRHLAFRVDRSG
jgi:AraC family transcriptional regulator, regulatory protein of adaptative response / DNA-3-methyladenine glycosylase II